MCTSDSVVTQHTTVGGVLWVVYCGWCTVGGVLWVATWVVYCGWRHGWCTVWNLVMFRVLMCCASGWLFTQRLQVCFDEMPPGATSSLCCLRVSFMLPVVEASNCVLVAVASHCVLVAVASDHVSTDVPRNNCAAGLEWESANSCRATHSPSWEQLSKWRSRCVRALLV